MDTSESPILGCPRWKYTRTTWPFRFVARRSTWPLKFYRSRDTANRWIGGRSAAFCMKCWPEFQHFMIRTAMNCFPKSKTKRLSCLPLSVLLWKIWCRNYLLKTQNSVLEAVIFLFFIKILKLFLFFIKNIEIFKKFYLIFLIQNKEYL